jgi:NAD(P) transhydrogenase subunit alpha
MIVGTVTETFPGERRVAITPHSVPFLVKSGVEVLLESGAGVAAGFSDVSYRERGARLAPDRGTVFAEAGLVLQVRGLGANLERGRADLDLVRRGQALAGLVDPLGEPRASRELAERGVSLFAMELIPRITRAQSMDVLSSMATVAGYKAVLLAADRLPKMFPMLMTAAGTIAPARVFVVGVGVAGLQAIATARRLGAVVEAYDVRPAVKEQVQSLGAKFVELELAAAQAEGKGGYAREMDEAFLEKQRAMMLRVLAESDVVITTAAVPGKKAPRLVTREMVERMRPGSVLVDLAAERGGNCELTKPGEVVDAGGVTIFGPLNPASDVPHDASQMYARNMATFVGHLVQKGELRIDTSDEITRETLIAHGGEVVHPRVREALGLSAEPTGAGAGHQS